MNFGDALEAVREGRSIRRKGWNGPHQYVRLHKASNGHEHMTHDYLYIVVRQRPTDLRMPWLASQADILFHDWEVVE